MDSRDLARMQAIFDAALERAPEEREGFVISACGADAVLRDQVLRLLRSAGTVGDAGTGGAAREAVRSAVRTATLAFTAAPAQAEIGRAHV